MRSLVERARKGLRASGRFRGEEEPSAAASSLARPRSEQCLGGSMVTEAALWSG